HSWRITTNWLARGPMRHGRRVSRGVCTGSGVGFLGTRLIHRQMLSGLGEQHKGLEPAPVAR
ncbi:MAG: hypothetical protein ACE1Z9_08690, partial [Acidimicrobiia bacterium]